MQAVILKDTGAVSQLQIEELEKPDIHHDEILVKTKAFSINPIEVKTRKGNPFSQKLLNDPPCILGWDASGIVEETGTDIHSFSKGDRVFGIIGFPKFGRTYADYFVARENDLCLIPENIDFAEAAVSNIAALTAYQALTLNADLKPGKKILIHAASGGVGHFGVQIAKHLGATVYATASKEKHEFVKKLGADVIIDYKNEKFEEVLPEKMDVVFDLIGGSYIDRSLKTLKKGGMIISIPSATNEKVVEKAKADGKTGIRFIMKANPTDLNAVADLLKTGVMNPHISQKYAMKDIRKAHQSLEDGHIKGKIAVLP